MSSPSASSGPNLFSLTVQNGREKEVLDRFEAAWRSGSRPILADFLAQVPESDRASLLRELLKLDSYYRRLAGETPQAADYTTLLPQYQTVIRDALTDERATLTPKPLSGDDTLIGAMLGPQYGVTPAISATRIGNYEILGEIARGGMGVVYKARQVGVNRIVALKVMLSGVHAGPDERQRFQREAEAAGHLDHPGIVPVYEVGEHEGLPFLSMGFVEGMSLKKLVQVGPLDPGRAAGLMADVADAVAYAHARGVIHRDLKPENILLSHDGRVRVTDFGLARRVEVRQGITVDGQVLGTPGYMPPEQAAGKLDQIGPPADIYGLGATLYYLLTGRPPFLASTPLDTLLQVLQQEPVPPQTLNPSVPPTLDAICLRCLVKEPSKRYASATDLACDLRRFQAERNTPLSEQLAHIQSWRIPRVLALSAGVLLPIVIYAVFVFATGRAPKLETSPTTSSAAPVTQSATLPPNDIKLEDRAVPASQSVQIESFRVVHFHDKGNTSELAGDIGVVSDKTFLNDAVRVSAKLSQPAYCYLIAFNPDGKVQLCSPANAQTRPELQASLDFPPGGGDAFYLTDQTGQQAFALVVSEAPLPPFSEWSRDAGRVPWQHVEPMSVVTFDADGVRVQNSLRGQIGKLKGVAVIDELCLFLKNTTPATTVRGVAFPVFPQKE